MVDLIDRKILFELDLNGRIPLSIISKKIKKSKQLIKYRIAKLEKEGYILGYKPIIDASKLGYYYCRCLFKFRSINRDSQEKILEFFSDKKETAWLGILDDYWDLGIGYWVKDLIDFKIIIDDFIKKFGRFLMNKEESVGLELVQFSNKYLINTNQFKEIKTLGKIDKVSLDIKDKKLLKLLIKNSRTPIIDLIDEIKLTPKAIKYRINNLIKKKILLGFKAEIDHKKFGYTHNKVFLYLQNLTKKDAGELFYYLKNIPNCIYITKPLGRADLEFEILNKDREEFFEYMQNLKEKFGNFIINYEHFVIHKELISRFAPLE